MTPRVSVVLPVRNAAATLGEALDSVLSQTFTDFELIALNDGTTDGSDAMLHAAAKRDRRVRVVDTGGRGLTLALNEGVRIASAPLIARQDADDRSRPSRFAAQVAYLDAHPRVAALGTAAITIDDRGKAVGRFPTRSGADAVRTALRSARATPVHGSMMVRREVVVALGGYRPAFVTSQDFDLWLRLVEHTDLDNLDEPLYDWRLSAGSVFGARRRLQLQYAGIAMAFAAERARFGSDSYAALADADGDLEAFASRYRMHGLLRAIWGMLLLRGLNDSRAAHRELALALRHGHLRPLPALMWCWTALGLSWPGGKPMAVPAARPSIRQ
jgi:glycosyltransferase involved in cell wall biosynthesis